MEGKFGGRAGGWLGIPVCHACRNDFLLRVEGLKMHRRKAHDLSVYKHRLLIERPFGIVWVGVVCVMSIQRYLD